MNILINLSTLKAGGGQNVGLNFISSLKYFNNRNHNFFFVVAKDSAIHKYLIASSIHNIIIFPSNPVKRILKEFFIGGNIIKKYSIDIIYTYFGVDLFPSSLKRVMGAADSNLYFPELDFWVEYKGIQKLKRRFVDKYRIWGLKRATGVIFENGLLEERGRKLFKLKETILIKPSITEIKENSKKIDLHIAENTPIGLFLCGWQRNKNFMLIPEIAYKLKEKRIKYHFVITAPKDNSYDHNEFEKKIKEMGVSDMVSIIGQIPKEKLPNLYNSIHHVFLLSKLESFSNNIIEAWYYKKILFVSDMLWSHYLCENSAVYVNRNSVVDIANKIIDILKGEISTKKLINNGLRLLGSYPTIIERTEQELEYLEYVYKNY